MSTESPEDSSSQQPEFKAITDEFDTQKGNENPKQSRRAMGTLAIVAASISFAAAGTIMAHSHGKGVELPPEPTLTYTSEAPLIQQQLYPPTALVDAQGVLKLAKEGSDPLYKPCGDVKPQILEQAHVEGDPQAKDSDSYDGNKQAVLTTSAEEVSKAFAAGYDNLTVSFVPQNEAGTFSAEDAECATNGPEALPVKDDKNGRRLALAKKRPFLVL